MHDKIGLVGWGVWASLRILIWPECLLICQTDFKNNFLDMVNGIGSKNVSIFKKVCMFFTSSNKFLQKFLLKFFPKTFPHGEFNRDSGYQRMYTSKSLKLRAFVMYVCQLDSLLRRPLNFFTWKKCFDFLGY